MKNFLLLMILPVVLIGCAFTIVDSTWLWEQAEMQGKNRVFLTNVGGKIQEVVWVSEVTGLIPIIAYSEAHHKGSHLLRAGRGDQVRVIDEHVRQYGNCQYRADLLMTKSSGDVMPVIFKSGR